MKLRSVILFILSLLLAIFAASFQDAPGYMDADYYFLGGQNLAAGNGFSEQILWNFLDDPNGLPHPSHGYWMPFASVMAAAGLIFNPTGGFDQAQLFFIAVAAFVPPLTANLADQVYRGHSKEKRKRNGWLAGLLALFPGFYFGFLTTTDSFAIYMVLGIIFFYTLYNDAYPPFRKSFLLGMVAGFMYLARSDGFLWLFLAPVAGWQRNPKQSAGSAMGGFFIVVSAWLVRNQFVFGSPFTPGGSRVLWWTKYDDLFAFPATILTPARWWSSGLGEILLTRLGAAGQNLVSALAVNGMVFLFPLALLGIWRLRTQLPIRTGTVIWGLVFLLMSFVFPFAGERGGFFHAAAAVQPLIWAVVPEGLSAFVDWGRRVRRWQPAEAERIFGIGFVLLAVLVTAVLGWGRVISPSLEEQGESDYAAVSEFILEFGGTTDAIVMVNNPPGFTLETGHPAIVIPDGGLTSILAAGAVYDARFLVLGPEQGLDQLYASPIGQPGINYIDQVGSYKVFYFLNEQ